MAIRINDGSGRQIGRAEGLRRIQMIIYFFIFYVIKQGLYLW
jgi:hypothetical protein